MPDGQSESNNASRQGTGHPRNRRWSKSGKNGRHSSSKLYAAIDLGTNNCRLLIVEKAGKKTDGVFRVRDSFSRIVRLGEGLDSTGCLSEAAMQRTIAALQICASKIRRANVKRMRCVATEACRQAENSEAFIADVRHQTGLRLEIIDGKAEVELATDGCRSLFRDDVDHIIVFDIGGGSTEVSRLERQPNGFFRLADSDSLPLGVVRLAERYAGEDPHDHGYEGMMDEVRARLGGFMGRQGMIDDISKLQIIGTSGTMTTLVAVQLGLARYDRSVVDGCTIAGEEVRAVIDKLRTQSRDELAANPCIGRERADLVLAGCSVLDILYERWPVAQFSVADRGLREGILLRLIGDDQKRRNRRALISRKPPVPEKEGQPHEPIA